MNSLKWFSVCALGALCGETVWAVDPMAPVPGALVIAGGGTLPAEARAEFVRLAGGKGKAKIVVIPTASADADNLSKYESFTRPWEEAGAASVALVHATKGLADNPAVPPNLRREAQARGVDPARLVFAQRTQTAAYLARYALADLFLDCYPFNGGTTVNDALWMGLPVLTRSGRTYASRMAGSLLQAAGLGELICGDLPSYVQQGVRLATTPGRLQALRQALQRERREGVLFDTPRLVRQLEALFEQVAGG
jgi:hypothetical protein